MHLNMYALILLLHSSSQKKKKATGTDPGSSIYATLPYAKVTLSAQSSKARFEDLVCYHPHDCIEGCVTCVFWQQLVQARTRASYDDGLSALSSAPVARGGHVMIRPERGEKFGGKH